MRVGSLVRVCQSIKEYRDILGEQTGIVLRVDRETNPQLIDIMWSDGPIESLYEDEIELLSD